MDLRRAARTRRSLKPNRQQRAAAARHSRAYRERQKARGVPTGAEIDAMIGSVLVRLACRAQGLKTDATHMLRLCEVVAKQFDRSDASLSELVERVACRIERMRAAM